MGEFPRENLQAANSPLATLEMAPSESELGGVPVRNSALLGEIVFLLARE
jgi:hypothetical protein